MRKLFHCAWREYKSTALTKAFFFGVVVFPIIIVGIIALAGSSSVLFQQKQALEGSIAIVDRTPDQVVVDRIRQRFNPEAIEARRERVRELTRRQFDNSPLPMTEEQKERAIDMAVRIADPGRFSRIDFLTLPADADVEAEKKKILAGERLALVVIDPSALTPGSGFQLLHSPSLDDDSIDDLAAGARDAIIRARLEFEGIDFDRLTTLQTRPEATISAITDVGETRHGSKFQKFIPVIFMMLLWISVMSGGQYLLMSTIEEKSSRVMEVLLSAVSPLQLMTGKILGQGMVGLTILVIYAGVGLVAADQFGFLGLVPTGLLVWLLLYFLMAFFLFAALMAAAGSAVTEIREAQALIGPIMMLLIIPIMLWMPIMENPNSVFSRVVSFFPPATPFVMVLRMCQNSEPVPLWEIIATTALGTLFVIFIIWAAAKIFRIGVLMYGKPPNLLGLVKMLRQA